MAVTIDAAPLPVKRHRIGPLAVLLIALAVVLVLLVLAFCLGLFLSAQRVKEELARIRSAGEPVTFADLEASYQLPPGIGDATPFWMAAAEAVAKPEYKADVVGLPFVGNVDDELPRPGDPWPQQYAVEKLLFKYVDILDDVRKAVELGGAARYPTRFADGEDITPPALLNLPSVASLLVLEGAAHAHRENSGATAESIDAIFALARSLDREPLLASQLVRLTIDAKATDSLERALTLAALRDDDLALLDRDLAAIDYYSSLHRSTMADRVFGIYAFDHPDRLGYEVPQGFARSIFRQADLAIYLQLMDEFIAASTVQDQPMLLATFDRISHKATDVTGTAIGQWRYPMTPLLVSYHLSMVEAVGQGAARRNVARMTIAAERFCRAEGHWPNALNDLVPAFAEQVLPDPFSGAPLKLELAGDGCRIRSVGPDGIDQAGSGEEKADDIVFRLPNRTAGHSPP